jgi:thiamine pyridinylase
MKIIGELSIVRQRLLFLKKKKQKDFCYFLYITQRRAAEKQKFFGSFFQKRTLLFLMNIVCGFAVAVALLPLAQAGTAERRVLHVSLYPYVPEAAAAALTLKQGFEKLHPEIIADITFNPHYYSVSPADRGVLYENADIHTIDGIFLADFLAAHRLAPLSQAFLRRLPAPETLAGLAAGDAGTQVAVPYWMCTNFLIYRKDLRGLDDVASLKALAKGLRGTGLALDMADRDALSELYYSALIADDGAHMPVELPAAGPDPAIVARLSRMLALEPHGFGREKAYGQRVGFYARQFARRRVGAFVGYSEMTHEVLTETATDCRLEEHCVEQDQIGVAAVPFHDGAPRPAVWVDMFGIDAKLRGQKLQDAEDFIAYAVSLPAYRAVLIPAEGEAPRYLLPATQEAFADAAIVRAAPLYPQFHAIIAQGYTATAPHLMEKLQALGEAIDHDLPPAH